MSLPFVPPRTEAIWDMPQAGNWGWGAPTSLGWRGPGTQPRGASWGISGSLSPPCLEHPLGTWGNRGAAAGSRTEEFSRLGARRVPPEGQVFRGRPLPDPLKPDTGLREVGASPVVPVPMLEGREVAVTGTLLRKILGHPEKPRAQLPGQPVRLPTEIPQARTGYVPWGGGRRRHGPGPPDPRCSGCQGPGRGASRSPHLGP